MMDKLKALLLDPPRRDGKRRESSPAADRRANPRHTRHHTGSNRVNSSHAAANRIQVNRDLARRANPRHNTPPDTAAADEEKRQTMWMGAAAVGVILIAFFVISGDEIDQPIAINPVTLCPVDDDQIISKTYLLVDLSESLHQDQRSGLRNLLTTATNSLSTREFISVSEMRAMAEAPREKVAQFCKPDIENIGLAGTRIKENKCSDIVVKNENDFIANKNFSWPANVGGKSREKIVDACRKYSNFTAKVNTIADSYKVANDKQDQSFIIGAIEDIMVEADDDSSNESLDVRTRLIVFSDMLQNSDWFSQYKGKNANSDNWTTENLNKKREKAATQPKYSHMKTIPNNNFNEVLLCYLPSNKMLNTSIKEKQHRQMWKGYFEDSKFEHVDFSGCAVKTAAMMKKT